MFCSCVFAPFFVFSNCCVTFQCSWALITTYYNPFFCELESHIGWLNRRAHFLETKVLLLQSFSYCKGLWSHNVSFLNQHIPTSHVPHLLPSDRHWVNSHPDCAPCDLETWPSKKWFATRVTPRTLGSLSMAETKGFYSGDIVPSSKSGTSAVFCMVYGITILWTSFGN